jgi:hypothetical protein
LALSTRIVLRSLTLSEEKQVQRARIMTAMLSDPSLSATEAGLRGGLNNAVGAKWGRRFNADGLAGLEHRLSSGRPRTHSEAVRSALIVLTLQKPQTLGYPFALWSLERLQRAFREREGTHLSDSTIWTCWRMQLDWISVTLTHLNFSAPTPKR